MTSVVLRRVRNCLSIIINRWQYTQLKQDTTVEQLLAESFSAECCHLVNGTELHEHCAVQLMLLQMYGSIGKLQGPITQKQYNHENPLKCIPLAHHLAHGMNLIVQKYSVYLYRDIKLPNLCCCWRKCELLMEKF